MPALPKPPGKAIRPRVRHVGIVSAPKLAPPPPPKGLLSGSRKRWEEFWRSDVSQTVDRASDMGKLERWIRAVDEYERVLKVFKTARLVKGSTGQPTLNPLASYLSTLEAQICKAEDAYGMSPIARLKLGIALGEAHKSLADLNAELEATNDDEDEERLTVLKEIQG
jgi:P27 family predicted phage terminase small subunit